MEEKIMKYIWVLNYDGKISTEAYDTEDKAFKRLEIQGYNQIIGYFFKNGESCCTVHCLTIK